jgi:hypothetical protein
LCWARLNKRAGAGKTGGTSAGYGGAVVPRFSSGAARPLSTLLGARRQRRFVSYLWVTVGAGLDGIERLVLRLTWVSDHSY